MKRQALSLSPVLGMLGLLILWWGITALHAINPLFLPPPERVAVRFYTWLKDGGLLGDLRYSFSRVMGGFLLAVVIGLPLGVAIGLSPRLRRALEPMLEFARYLPAVAFVPLIMLWVGIGEWAKIAVIWIGTFFQLTLLVAEDVRKVPSRLLEVARTMGATNGELIRLVVLPHSMPRIVDTFRVCLGWAWTYLVVAELVAANSGVGYAILRAQRFLQTDKIFVGILLIGLMGLLFDQGLRWMHRRLFPWLYL